MRGVAVQLLHAPPPLVGAGGRTTSGQHAPAVAVLPSRDGGAVTWQ